MPKIGVFPTGDGCWSVVVMLDDGSLVDRRHDCREKAELDMLSVMISMAMMAFIAREGD